MIHPSSTNETSSIENGASSNLSKEQVASNSQTSGEMKWADYEKGEIHKIKVSNFTTLDYCQSIDISRLKQILKPDSSKGQTGSRNLGNTCFLNSAIQCLSNSIELTTYFLTGDFKKDINTSNKEGLKGKLANAWYDLLTQLWIKNKHSVDASDVKYEVSRKADIFSGYNQNDSHEFITFFLDCLGEDLNRNKTKKFEEIKEKGENESIYEAALRFWKCHLSKNNSIISDLFTGQFQSIVQCTNCNWVSNTFHPFLSISLPIPRKHIFQVFYIPKYEIGKALKIPIYITELTLFGSLTERFKDISSFQYKPKYLKYALVIDSRVRNYPTPDSNCSQLSKNIYTFIYEGEDNSNKMNSYEMILQTEQPQSASSYPRLLFLNEEVTYDELLRKIYYHVRKYITFPIEENENEFRKCIEQYLEKPTNEKELFELLNKEYDILFNNENKSEEVIKFLENLPFSFSMFSDNENGKWYVIAFNKNVNKKEYNVEEFPISNKNDNIKDLLLKLKEDKLVFSLQITSTNPYCVPKLLFNGCIPLNKNLNESFMHISLEDCLDAFYEKEKLTIGNEWKCKQCKKTVKGLKQIKLFYLPKLLIIHLNRFVKRESHYSYFGCHIEKNDETIRFPIDELDLSSHVTGPQENVKYYLYGVSQHYGGCGGGHYTAMCKNDGAWYNYDDSYCSRADNREIVTSAAYVLFYRRKD